MSKRLQTGILVVSLLAIGSWAIAQVERVEVKMLNDGGPFVVSGAGDSAVLLDTKSGKTWFLQRSVTGDRVWLPAKRIDSDDEVAAWRKQEAYLKEILKAEEEEKLRAKDRK